MNCDHLFSPTSNDNTLFVTAQCNNRCIMCCQPPDRRDDIEMRYRRNLSLLENAPKELRELGINGGEPTLLGDRLFQLLEAVHELLPSTGIHLLSNGRAFSDFSYAKKLHSVASENLLLGIPLHSDYSGDHDEVTRIPGSFDETMRGLYHLGEFGIRVELRVLITRYNYRRLRKISDFLYRHLPFVDFVAFMGMEVTGWAVRHMDQLWIDPVDFREYLEDAVLTLSGWGMDCCVYNIPHCLLSESLHPYACQSISDWKTEFSADCDSCRKRKACCGLFRTSRKQSRALAPFLA